MTATNPQAIKQKHLPDRLMILFIAFMNMFVPLSTDLYLPAMPEMGQHFGAPQALVSLTLTGFFFFYAISILLFGPLSDKYGRRPILIAGTSVYTLASFICIVAPDIYTLIAGRIVQAIGSGAIITIATALIKDIFSGNLMKKMLALTQSLSVIAPMVAPVVGGMLLTVTSWHGCFMLLTVLGALNFLVALLLTETLPTENRYQGKVLNSLSLVWGFVRRKEFITLLVVFACFSAPYMAYISLSSFIYIEKFGLTAQTYSHYYALNAAASILGPFLYLRLSQRLSRFQLTHLCFAGFCLSCVLVFMIGHSGAVAFLLCFVPMTVCNSVSKPFCINWLLSETADSAGTASSVIKFVQTLFGSFGMLAGSLPWSDYVGGLNIIMITAMTLSFLLWQVAKRYYSNTFKR